LSLSANRGQTVQESCSKFTKCSYRPSVDRLGLSYENVCNAIRHFIRRGVIIRTMINGFTCDGAPKNAIQQALRGRRHRHRDHWSVGCGEGSEGSTGSGVTLRAAQSASATALRYLLRGPDVTLVFGHAIVPNKRINVARQ
jgi:hypothetical protein